MLVSLVVLTATISTTTALAVGSLGLVYPQLIQAFLDQDVRQFERANRQYERGDLEEAIALAEAIAPTSSTYDAARDAVRLWRVEWDQLQQALRTIEAAQAREDWDTVLLTAAQLPTKAAWQPQRTELMQQAQGAVNQQARSLLQQAFTAAYDRNFGQALMYLQEISTYADNYSLVSKKIVEYTESRNIRAQYHLQAAFNEAEARNFHQALSFLQQVDANTPTYAIAQQKVVEYTEKRDLRAQYLILRAGDRATLQDYRGAILLLQQVSPDSPVYADAQAQILSYGEQLTSQPPKPATSQPAAAAESAPTPKPASLNPGDRLTEIAPDDALKP